MSLARSASASRQALKGKGRIAAGGVGAAPCTTCSSFSTSTSTSAAAPSTSRTPTSASSSLIRPVRIVPPRPAAGQPKKSPPKKIAASKQQSVSPAAKAKAEAVREREAFVSTLYALHAPPSKASIAALANRISPDLLGVRASAETKAPSDLESGNAGDDSNREYLLAALEQCCTCSSFWTVVTEQEAARRQQPAEERVQLSETRFTNFLDAKRTDNQQLAVLGNHLLGVFTLEWLEAKYPNLPEKVLKAALTLYAGPRTCADIATKSWGITTGQASRRAFFPPSSSAINTYDNPQGHHPGQSLRGVGEGNRAGNGLLRWGRPAGEELDRILAANTIANARGVRADKEKEKDYRTPLPLEEALASATRAIIGLIFQEHGFAAIRSFVHATFLSRQADLASLLKFPNPKYSLQSTLKKYGRTPAVTHLLGETGRLSIAPLFVSGVYSGSIKLGEGFGSSLAMAEFRANEDALRRIYLSPVEGGDPVTAATQQQQRPLGTELELPTDTLVYPGRRLNKVRALADEDILWQSSGKSGVVAASRA